MFQRLTSLEEIENFIRENKLAFLYLSSPHCSVCHGLLPQVKEVLQHYPSIQTAHINIEEVPEVSGRFSVFTVPVLLLLIEGKEYIREARIVHLDQFQQKVDKIYKLMNSNEQY